MTKSISLKLYIVTAALLYHVTSTNIRSELLEFQGPPCLKQAQYLKVIAARLEMHGCC